MARLSLRSRLALALVLVLGLSLAGFSWVVQGAFARALWAQFDARLAEDASAVGTMIELHRDGRLEFESGPLLGFEAEDGRSYFEVWTDDGAIFARSPSLGPRDLPRFGRDGIASVVLPDGRRGRGLEVRLPPRVDPDDPPFPRNARIVVVVARGVGEVEAALSDLRLLLWASGLAALVLASAAGAVAIRRGLVPVRRLSDSVDAIDARQLASRLPMGGLPAELRPTVAKVNELLARLEASFDRERRLAADASHELRTPLAGLRTTLEVALSRPRAAEEYREAMDEALAVVVEMSALVESLLALARADHDPGPAARERVVVAELVDQCHAACRPRFAARGLAFENRVAPDAVLETDRERLRIVTLNLMANAADYTAEGGRVVAGSDPRRGVWLEIADSGPAIPADLVDTIFDRFFRGDGARPAASGHWGIGLALVRALCDTLALDVTAENRPDGWVVFRVRGSEG